MAIKYKTYIGVLIALFASCSPFEAVGDFDKSVMLEKDDAVVMVSAAMGSHDRWSNDWHFVFKIEASGNDFKYICEIVILELPDSLLEYLSVTVQDGTDIRIWSESSYHVARLPELGWSARLTNGD